MEKVVVLGGAGGMGSMAVKDLVLNENCKQIIIADADVNAANRIKDEINSDNVFVQQVDVTDNQGLVQLLTGAEIVINFIGPFYKYAPMIIRACIKAKTNYVDICDDFDAAEIILEMDQEVKKAGITVLTGMGTSPGLTNILAKMGMNELDLTEEIDMNWVMGDSETGSAVLYHFFHCGTGVVPGYKDGKKTMIKPFKEDGSVTINFPEPLNQVKVYDIGHPEPITFPYFYPDVKKVSNKGTLLPSEIVDKIKLLFDLGFGSIKEMDFQGVKISPRDFAVKYIQENPEFMEVDGSHGFGGLKVIVKGIKDGAETSYVYTTVTSESTAESVAIPAVAGAKLIVTGKVKNNGVIAPEVLNPMDVFNLIGNRKRSSNVPIVSSGLIIERINSDGSVEIIRKGRTIQ